MTLSKHFVTFYSPGTFVAEQTTREIDSWDVDQAIRLADEISERHNATPYGFRFTTKSRSEDELDSKVSASSPLHYLGGEILTLQDVISRNNPKDKILISNMEGNGWNRIIVNSNSWKWTQHLEEDDIVLDYTPPAKRKPETVSSADR